MVTKSIIGEVKKLSKVVVMWIMTAAVWTGALVVALASSPVAGIFIGTLVGIILGSSAGVPLLGGLLGSILGYLLATRLEELIREKGW